MAKALEAWEWSNEERRSFKGSIRRPLKDGLWGQEMGIVR